MAVMWATLVHMPTTQEKTWRAGRFWWCQRADPKRCVSAARRDL